MLGERKAGKTSLLQTFLSTGKEETPKATVALEYSYARAPTALQTSRDICHIYELGGGRMLHNLVPIVITPEVLPSLVVVLVIDMSSPHKVLESYLFWLQVLRARIDECMAELRARSPKLTEKLEARMNKQWASHEDRTTVAPFPVPVIAVASKYDVLANEESEKRKWMARCLRYFSHRYGVDLLYSSQRDTRLTGAVSATQLRQTLSSWVFGGGRRKLDFKDHSQPILVSAGADSFQQIGPPPSVMYNQSRGDSGNLEQLWERALSGVFPKPQK